MPHANVMTYHSAIQLPSDMPDFSLGSRTTGTECAEAATLEDALPSIEFLKIRFAEMQRLGRKSDDTY